MFLITGLWHQYAMIPGPSFNEVMRANICHNLCSRVNLSVQLLLQLTDGLKIAYLISNDLIVIHGEPRM